jgi:polynucleotide 5'-hydroxyl-kinase GRC3/NOL9
MAEADAAALDAAARVRVTVIVGAGDTGKTTLATQLASALAARGASVAVVDADVGQSEIGPPTTVGLGRVPAPIGRLREAEVLALEFIGDTSPVRDIGRTADATGRLVRRALAEGFAHVIVDTGGLVEGALGLALKRAKLRAVDPDLIVIVQRSGESEALARALGGAERPAVLRVRASAAAVRRTQTARRLHRERALADYFRDATAVALPLDRLQPRAGTRGAPPPPVVAGLLAGVLDAEGVVVGIARVSEVDVAANRIVVDTPVASGKIRGLLGGRAVWTPGR